MGVKSPNISLCDQ